MENLLRYFGISRILCLTYLTTCSFFIFYCLHFFVIEEDSIIKAETKQDIVRLIIFN